ncbi:MAG: hypothetical protein U9R51_07940 [Actinomycetota bacterium]|nr:hypothetical protein [Actinomycetota bacterium]
MTPLNQDRIRLALEKDRVVDIITTGARSRLQRTTEIWFTNVSGRIIICGTPGGTGGNGPRVPRDWLANLVAYPEFTFCLKESVEACLPARATPVGDVVQRRALMSAPETQWYRDEVDSVDDLVEHSPIVDVMFTGEYGWLNP